MRPPTLWLKNSAGEIWNLRPRDFSEENGSFFKAIDGTGFETKLQVARVKNDFVVMESVPQQVEITGEMYFRDPAHMKRFGEFLGDYGNSVPLYYDPEGKIDPHSQIDRPYYKMVKIRKVTSGEQDSHGYWKCKMTLSPLSAMWKRDLTIATTATEIIGGPLVYSYVYPYFYTSESKLYLKILNEGEKIGCKIQITNKKQSSNLSKLFWYCEALDDETRQYAQWLQGVGLEPNRTLIVDSNYSSQKAVVTYDTGEDDVSDYQEPNPRYVNFIELHPGENLIMFDVGTVDQAEVEITVSYTEEVRIL